MAKAARTLLISAGVLAWRGLPTAPEFLLVHPGGPYWAKKDEAAWSIPKGLVEADEADWDAAAREFEEELGLSVAGPGEALTPCKTSGDKVVKAWLVSANFDVSRIRSNTFEIEWPPRSGRRAVFPEVDRAGWFDPETAAVKIHKGQRPILVEALARLREGRT
jgi:predicted NUDIX family NTP pyrophosphohydrolase